MFVREEVEAAAVLQQAANSADMSVVYHKIFIDMQLGFIITSRPDAISARKECRCPERLGYERLNHCCSSR